MNREQTPALYEILAPSRVSRPECSVPPEVDFWGRGVVHVVQDSVIRAPQKYPAPLTITVNSGSLWSVENAEHTASIREGAGRGVGVSE
jgi:hypothetical protein